MANYDKQVFLNVPFDVRYKKLLRGLVFAVHECGLVARSAQEKDDSAQVRVEKLYAIIGDCRFGIHDLSRTTLDSQYRLPRFNMPFELGVFLGARKFGLSAQRKKVCLILDRDRYRFQKFCSDISGQDIRAHDNQVSSALAAVRNWLQTHLSVQQRLPGPKALLERYIRFQRQLPFMCQEMNLDLRETTFLDYQLLVEGWRAANPATVLFRAARRARGA